MLTTNTIRCAALAACGALSLWACDEDAERPTVDVSSIMPDPLPPEAGQGGAPGVSIARPPQSDLDAGGSTPSAPAPSPAPGANDAGPDAGLRLPSPDDLLGFDAAISPPNAAR